MSMNDPVPARAARGPFAMFVFAVGIAFGLMIAVGGYVVVARAFRPPKLAVPQSPVFPREEFTRLVEGKSTDEVVAAVGRPDATSEDNGAEYWHYKKRTRDPLTQEEDSDVQVVIKKGKVANINY